MKMTEEEIFEFLKKRLYDKTIYPCEVRPLDIEYCRVKILDGKIYAPSFIDSNRISSVPVIEYYYIFPQYWTTATITRDIDIQKITGYYPAKEGDDVYCKCLNKQFTFSYGSYELMVKCVKCGNTWTAYSG